MIPLLTAQQIREADAYTIKHEPLSSLELMERASKAFVGWFVNHFPDKNKGISVYCGTGNNGGDGLAIARMLYQHGYNGVKVLIARYSEKQSEDFKANLQRLADTDVKAKDLLTGAMLPDEDSPVIIDALLGTGLNKPLAGDYKKLAEYINSLNKTVVAVDVPTGFSTDGDVPPDATVIKADLVITFQQPRINFLLPESGPYVDCCEVVNIGLDEEYIRSLESPYQYITDKDVRQMLRPRKRFSNKGTYGHALIIAGETETMGAALLSASACAWAGAGLTTACIPSSGLTALNTYQPEVMAIVRNEGELPDIEWEKFAAIGIGPGLGKGNTARTLLSALFQYYSKPVVIDADGLNVLATNEHLMKHLPEGSILTPHMKEFDRLFGEHTTWWQRLQTGIQKAVEMKIYVVLKNDYTITFTPEGKAYFNSTSNAAMASGGMGDVLTGIITALLAQRYTPLQACLLGVYIHGKAGDELALPARMHVTLPGKLIAQLPVTMAKLR